MKKSYKNFLIVLPLAISILAYLIYCSIELLALRPKGLSWRPYVTTGMFIVITMGLIIFFVLLVCKLLKGLKQQIKTKKILRLIASAVLGCTTIWIAICGVVFVSLTFTHEKVVKTDDIKYISCLSDWNPIYYHHHEYDSWFTMSDEPFESIKNEI